MREQIFSSFVNTAIFMSEIGKDIEWVAGKVLSVNRLQRGWQLQLQVRHITPIIW